MKPSESTVAGAVFVARRFPLMIRLRATFQQTQKPANCVIHTLHNIRAGEMIGEPFAAFFVEIVLPSVRAD